MSDETKTGPGADMIWKEFEVASSNEPFEAENIGAGAFVPMGNAQEADRPGFIPFWNRNVDDRQRPEAEETKAEDLIKQAQDRIARLEEEAYEKGFEQGERDGRDLGEKKARKILDRFEKLLLEMGHLKKTLLKRYERDLLELVFAIANKILHEKIDKGEHVIESSVIRALALATDKSQVDLRINPDDFEHIERLKPELVAEFNQMKSIVVTADPSVTRGGCLLETRCGDVDASIETQMEKIYCCLDSTYGKNQDDQPDRNRVEKIP